METGIVKLTPELLALFAGSDSTNALAPFTREVFLLDITVAGTGFCDKINEVFPQLQIDTVLKMQRDPKNQYDENARLMDAGKAFFCRVTNLGSDKGSWKQIDCKIFMVE